MKQFSNIDFWSTSQIHTKIFHLLVKSIHKEDDKKMFWKNDIN